MAPDTAVATESQTATGPSADTEDITSQIDEAIANTHVGDGPSNTGDVDPNSLEGRLRLALPGHTFFRKAAEIPGGLRNLLEKMGASDDQVVDMGGPQLLQAMYTEPDGYWLLKITSCHDGSHGYQVSVDGPGTDVQRECDSVDAVLNLLRILGAIK